MNQQPSHAEATARAERLHSYLQSDPDNPHLLLQVADLYLQLGQPALARPVLDRLSSLRPDDGTTQYLMASLLFQEQRFAESMELTCSMIEAGETHPVVRFHFARVLAQMERFEEAEPVLAGLVGEGSEVPGLPHLYIRTLHHVGKFDEAIEFAAAHMSRHPGDAAAAGMLSLLYLDDDRLIEASLMAEQTLEAQPLNLDALVTRGFVSLAFAEFHKAERQFAQALQIDDSSGRAHLGQALCAMVRHDLGSGRAALERAVECMPLHLGTWNALAWVQILQGDDEAALRTLQQCLRIDRRFGETYGAFAVIAARYGRWEEVQRLADKAVRLQPDGFAGRFARSLLVARNGDPQQARAMVDSLLKNTAMPGGGSLEDVVRRFSAVHKPQARMPLSTTLPDGSRHTLH